MAARKTSQRAKKKSNYPKSLQDVIKFAQKNKALSAVIAMGVLVLVLLAFPFRFLIVPAVVNGQPIFSWQYISQLHQNSGQQVLSQLISEKLVEQEVAKQGIQITETEINQQLSQLEEQFGGESGGLEAVLALQGLGKDEFIKQLRLNLALEKLVKGTIQISEDDIAQELSENSDIYLDLSELDAATTAAENIRNSQLQDAFQAWFQELQAKANIQNFFSGSPSQAPGVAL